MRLTRHGLFASILLIGLTACTPAPPPIDTAAEERALRAGEEQWTKDIAARDIEKWLSHYADDATLMAPGAPPVTGKESIKAMLKGMLDDPAIKLTFAPQHVAVAKSGELAYSSGSYEMTMTDPATKKPVNDHGSYVTVYRKDAGGKWLAISDINTSAVPPAPPAK